MTETIAGTNINKGFDSRPKAGNDTASFECNPRASGTAQPSRKTRHQVCWPCENMLKSVHHTRSDRLEHRAQSPAPNNNPHSTRSTI